MPSFDFSGSFTAGVVLLSLLLASVLAYLAYRRTLPPISQTWRFVLAILRTAMLFLLFVLLGTPILSLVYRSTDLPAIAILVDNSESMTLSSRSGQGAQNIANIVEASRIRSLDGDADLHWYLFDHSLQKLESWSPGMVTLTGDRTDMAGALESLRKDRPSNNLQAVVIISDGNPTTHIQPSYSAEALGVP